MTTHVSAPYRSLLSTRDSSSWHLFCKGSAQLRITFFCFFCFFSCAVQDDRDCDADVDVDAAADDDWFYRSRFRVAFQHLGQTIGQMNWFTARPAQITMRSSSW